MILSTYGAPSQPSGKNPLVIILGVCGGCVLLVIIAVVVMGVMGLNAIKGLTGGAMKMPQTEMTFVKSIETQNYARAASLVDPSARATLTESKIKSIVEQAEKKLGTIQVTNVRQVQPSGGQVSENGHMYLEYVYNIPLQFQKGSATGVLKFRSEDLGPHPSPASMKLSGLVTSFKIQADSP